MAGVGLLFASDNQPGCQSTVEGYGIAAATTAVGWSGWADVAVVLPAVSTADRRGESLELVYDDSLLAAINQGVSLQSRDLVWLLRRLSDGVVVDGISALRYQC